MGHVQAFGVPVLREIDWTEIFERRPDLSPPGYEEAVEALKQRPKRERKRSRTKGKEAKFTGLKHTNPDP